MELTVKATTLKILKRQIFLQIALTESKRGAVTLAVYSEMFSLSWSYEEGFLVRAEYTLRAKPFCTACSVKRNVSTTVFV